MMEENKYEGVGRKNEMVVERKREREIQKGQDVLK